jgi:hypothetical protein
MGYDPERLSYEPRNISVAAGTTERMLCVNEYLYLINVECPLDTDPAILFNASSDTMDTTEDDFFVNQLPFNVKEFTGNIELTNLNTNDAITFIFIHVIPE